MGMQKIAFVGTGGVGKTTIAALISAYSQGVELYDFDPLGGLRSLVKKCKTERDLLVQPAIIDTRATESLLRFLGSNPDVKLLYFVTPHPHKVAETEELIRSFEHYQLSNVPIGVVVNKVVGKDEGVSVRGLNVVSTIPYSAAIDRLLSEGSVPEDGVRLEKTVEEAIVDLVHKLGLKVREVKKRRSILSFK
jgi:MinD superfamily P-loop ATPase